VALRNRARGSRFAVRLLERWLGEVGPEIEEAALAAACLAALGGSGHNEAVAALRLLFGPRA